MLAQDQVVVITGASGDIGQALARCYAAAGARLVAHCFRNRDPLDLLCAELAESGSEIVVCQQDLSGDTGAAAVIDAAVDSWGRIDVLVNNAGIGGDAFLLMQSEESWRGIVDTNLVATMLCSRAALKPMLARKSGAIVNVSSLSGLIGRPGQTAYSASKAGVIGFTRSLACEMAAKNIRVNAIAPGLIASRWVEGMVGGADIRNIPMRRQGGPDEVANVALFLSSHLASYVTGVTINVSGGLYTGP